MNSHTDSAVMIQAMLKSAIYPHEVEKCELIETHISWVILTGQFVYKIKKPVNFGFLDFSTLDKRKFYCEEELRLNRRLAPDIYLDVIPISGSTDNPRLDGTGEVLDYAVKMKQFPRQIELDQLLNRGELNNKIIDSTAVLVAEFHLAIDVAEDDSDFGKPGIVIKPIRENFSQIRERIKDEVTLNKLTQIEQWSEDRFGKIKAILKQRKSQGFVRECHGDLHLRNLAWYQDKPLAFDCLEFNPNFRWIDIISEIAFLIMDLEDHQQAALGQRFLNQYLEISGDYAGCRVLNFYLVYRAMVRAKVAAIRSQQQGIKKEDMNSAITEFNNYLELALKYTQQHPPFLLITSGVSGSGKSTFSAPISEKLGAIRIRSDVERKRLFNISMELQFQNKIAQGIYSEAATEKTYLKLLELAETLLRAGYPVIVDATFSTYSQRQRFKQLADKSNCRFIILEFIATNKTLQQRITKRKNDISDADLNVLKSQLSHWHALEPTERRYTYAIDTEKPFVLSQLIKDLKF